MPARQQPQQQPWQQPRQQPRQCITKGWQTWLARPAMTTNARRQLLELQRMLRRGLAAAWAAVCWAVPPSTLLLLLRMSWRMSTK